MVYVKNRRCITQGCCNRPSFGVAGTRMAEYWIQHASDGMIDVKSRKCRTKGRGKHSLHGMDGTKTSECCAQHAPDGMVDVKSRKCRTEGCGKGPSFGVTGAKTPEYCTQNATDAMVDVRSRKCRTEGCRKGPSYGVTGTKTAEYCAQHAPEAMVNVKSKKCRTGGCCKKPSFRVANTRTVEYCAQHARLKCGVEGYREGEVDPHHSGTETVGNILPNGAKHQTVHPLATTSPPSEGCQGSRKRIRHPELTSTASMRPISRKSAGGAGIMHDSDEQKSPVKRNVFCERRGAALLVARYAIRDLKLYLRSICFISLLLSSCLSCIPLLIGLPFSRGLLTRMFFLPYAYHVVVFCLFLFFCFYFLLIVYFSFVSLLWPSLAMMFFGDKFPVRFLLSAFPKFFSECVPGLI